MPAPDPAGPVLLHRTRSAHHEIHVYQSGTTRYLTFEAGDGAALQSIQDHEAPQRLAEGYRHGLAVAAALHPAPRRVLCLGVGAGPLPLALRRALPDAVVDAVDLDADVIRVAGDWFGLAADERLRLHVADARDFVRRACAAGHRWDVVLHDVFDRDYIPAHLMTTEYFREIAHVIETDGVFAINTFAQNAFHARELATYAEVLGEFCQVTTDGPNRVIVGWAAAMPPASVLHGRLRERAEALSRAGVCADAMVQRLRPVAPFAHGARPITDEDVRHAELASMRKLAIEEALAAAWGTAAA